MPSPFTPQDDSSNSNSVAVDEDERGDIDIVLSMPGKPRQRRASLNNALPGVPMVHKKGRRASLGPIPTMQSSGHYAARPTGVRRASMNGVMTTGRPAPADGYEEEPEISKSSMQNMQRRASLKAQRRASATGGGYHGPPKRMPSNEAMPRHTRRGSAGPGYDVSGVPILSHSRRGSAGPGYLSGYHSYEGPPLQPAVSDYRRSHSYDERPLLEQQGRRGSAAAGVNMPRRMSASRDGNGYGTAPTHRRMRRRGSSGMVHGQDGFNSQVIMPGRASGPKIFPQRAADDSDSSDDDGANMYGYGDSTGYGYNTPYTSKSGTGSGVDYGYGDVGGRQSSGQSARRGSNGSRVSQASRRSQRRNSTVIQPDRSPFITNDITTSSAVVPESDLEDSASEAGEVRPPRSRRPSFQRSMSRTGPDMYGYEQPAESSTLNVYGYGDDSASDSEASFASSNASRRRSRRRNSCIVRPNQDPRKVFSMLGNASRMSDRDLSSRDEESEEEVDDLNDPDSLLSRSGFGKKDTSDDDLLFDKTGPRRGMSKRDIQHNSRHAKDNGALDIEPDTAKRTDAPKEAWNRSRPFTTSHAKPTSTALQVDNVGSELRIAKSGWGHGLTGWGELQLESSDEDSSGDISSEERYGPRMYIDSEYFEEIDEFKQRARSNESVKEEMVSIAKQTVDLAQEHRADVIRFKPAETYDNASGYILRVFTARLRQGITVMKHNKSRWSKSAYRVLTLLPDGKTLTWKPLEGEQDKGKRPKVDLTKCREVRHAFTKDPDTRKLTGTSVLRKRCKENMASRSLSLIFHKRTLDITALNVDQCKILMEGFSALCFRLQVARLEEDPRDLRTTNDNVSLASASGDFASTVYGDTVSVTVSKTSRESKDTKYQIPVPPWGL